MEAATALLASASAVLTTSMTASQIIVQGFGQTQLPEQSNSLPNKPAEVRPLGKPTLTMKLTEPPLWIAVPLCMIIGACIVPALVILKHIINP